MYKPFNTGQIRATLPTVLKWDPPIREVSVTMETQEKNNNVHTLTYSTMNNTIRSVFLQYTLSNNLRTYKKKKKIYTDTANTDFQFSIIILLLLFDYLICNAFFVALLSSSWPQKVHSLVSLSFLHCIVLQHWLKNAKMQISSFCTHPCVIYNTWKENPLSVPFISMTVAQLPQDLQKSGPQNFESLTPCD